MNELRREREREREMLSQHCRTALLLLLLLYIYILCEWPVCFNGYILRIILRTSFAHRATDSWHTQKRTTLRRVCVSEWVIVIKHERKKRARFIVDTFTLAHTHTHYELDAHSSIESETPLRLPRPLPRLRFPSFLFSGFRRVWGQG